jgi:hypothetical protein
VSQRLATRATEWIASRTSRRGFLVRTAIGGAALSTNPIDFALRPISAYAAACECRGQNCACGTACCDGYTEFCCTLNGRNTCPPGTIAAGWWKADGSGMCSGGPRYYIDCNVAPGQNPCSCGCALQDCDNRVTCCTMFRYGQCHQEYPVVGAIMCRVVTCTPPWYIDATCSTAVATDELTATHDAPCLHYTYLSTSPPIGPDAGWGVYGIFRLYFTVLGRYPDKVGFDYFAGQLNDGKVLGQLADIMISTNEFAAKGNLSDSQFITLIYNQGLSRAPDASGQQFLTSLLQSGRTRGDVANWLAQSTEAQTTLVVRIVNGLLRRLYLAALLRPGDAAGLYYWDRRLWEGITIDLIARAFCLTPEFRSRYDAMTNQQFVEAMYRNALGRDGDGAGIVYWVARLDSGMPRYVLVLNFADSPECKQKTGIP